MRNDGIMQHEVVLQDAHNAYYRVFDVKFFDVKFIEQMSLIGDFGRVSFVGKKRNKMLSDEFREWLQEHNMRFPEISLFYGYDNYYSWTFKLRFDNQRDAMIFRMWL